MASQYSCQSGRTSTFHHNCKCIRKTLTGRQYTECSFSLKINCKCLLFSCSTKRKIANAIHSSLTTTILSINGRAVKNALYPTIGTAKPSAKVGSIVVCTGPLCSSAFEKLGHLSDSTPCNSHVNNDEFKQFKRCKKCLQ